jgi:hypothetical protein
MGTARTLVRAGAMATSIGLALLCAGCGGGKTGSSAESSQQSAQSAPESTAAQSRYQTFDQVPGPTLTYTPTTETGTGLKLDVKPMKAEWTAQFVTKPADPGKHFLVVYMAATPTAKDRGFESLTLREVNVRYRDPHVSLQSCPPAAPYAPMFVLNYCYRPSVIPKSAMVALASDWEHMVAWDPVSLGTNLTPGQAYAGIGVFAIPDNAPNSFELCGYEEHPDAPRGAQPGPCIKLDTPPRP